MIYPHGGEGRGAAPGLEPRTTSMQPKSTLSRLALAAADMLLKAPASPATAETFVIDLRLEDGGSQRVLGAAPTRTATASFHGTWLVGELRRARISHWARSKAISR